MPGPSRILQAVLLSAGLPVVVLVLSARHRRGRDIGAVPGTVLGFFAGCAWLGLWPRWPPREDLDRFLLILIPAVAVVELAAVVVGKWAWPVRLGIAGSAAWILLSGTVYLEELAGPGSREWTRGQTWLILGGLALGLGGVWASLTGLVRRKGGRGVVLALALASAGAGIAVLFSGYATGGLPGLPLAAALAGVLLTSWYLGPLDLTGAVGLGTVGLFSLLVLGRFFGELSTSHAIGIFLFPLACALLGWSKLGRSGLAE